MSIPEKAWYNSPLRMLAVVIAAAVLLGVSFWGGLDREGEKVTNELLMKGTITYAVTRAAMAGLSVVEEIEISAAVVSGKPFRVLRPLIDLLDRFSSVLFFSISSLALLKLLTYLFGTAAFSLLYAGVVAAVVLLFIVMPPYKQKLMEYWPWRVFLVATVIRFAFVLIVGLNFLTHQVFLAERQEAAMAELEHRAGIVESISGEIMTISTPGADRSATPQRVEPAPAEPQAGFFERWGQRLSPTRLLEDLKVKADAVVDSVIDITVLFLLQAVVIPLLFFWCIVNLLRRLSP
ncbi:MAG: hypothetical protein LC632_01520 [Xanthomonadaceae bacterium]|nr:hypothetical protein [Xanthomonadaceae bacterium]